MATVDEPEDSSLAEPGAIGQPLPTMLEPAITAALLTLLGTAGVEAPRVVAALRGASEPRRPLSVVVRKSSTDRDFHRIGLHVQNLGGHGVVLQALSLKEGNLYTDTAATLPALRTMGASSDPSPPRPIGGVTLEGGKGLDILVDLARRAQVAAVHRFVTLRLSYVVLGCGEDARQGTEFPVAILDPQEAQASSP
jgi:hypothetical protein